ncbi:MAG: hypothetical protein COZ46_06120 [Verrucomicrobia bacterium CG_4_10_14_3_um_filter_43_23]|nr:MAG: hypothetical protein AUJ82_07840 [Verrucomicrobia bacterium CG1_02_43_26]PIP59348.1 MAG: hypothetical protein COX01_04055 [Verrucomicrobia bacterium CG22_combo_CG10-13_8_21_14_all_43_17]PIX57973.1 MAG: hypothetical protein COZ46_06120 [Verrucomicrobia bacterium CG_4_10_14_3_um_filter_43_23]PIY61624.1 MAG: hypothetical protein COY94_04395 [Verrucomicrobia bacterium CG_4_10_14_0_8_um_filter_43_34]PJA43985.1 MAG: hypothetical protein CO175_05235 [Verrucomicrobia bacterium CG_4_9_14_3_um_fi
MKVPSLAPFTRRILALLGLLGLAVALVGCGARQRADIKERSYTPFEASNIYSANTLPDDLKRVAMLPMYDTQISDEQLEMMDQTFLGELNKQNLFEVVYISRDDLEYLFKQRQFNSAEALPANFFKVIQQTYATNGVIFLDLTHYQPYRPISIGVRSKLVDISNGSILWAFDTVFDSGNPHVASAARQFQMNYNKASYPLDTGGVILKSPRIFSKYVAYEMFSTIPRR